jgi:hypothetical protein
MAETYRNILRVFPYSLVFGDNPPIFIMYVKTTIVNFGRPLTKNDLYDKVLWFPFSHK